MKKIWRCLSLVLGLVLVAILVVGAFQFFANLRTRRKAEALLASMRTLEIGKTTIQDAQHILTSYKADKTRTNCSVPGIGYSILLSNGVFGRLGLEHPSLLRMGVRPLGVAATMSFAGERLCEFRYLPSATLAGSQLPWKDDMLTAQPAVEISVGTAIEMTTHNEGSPHENYTISYFQNLLRSQSGGTRLALRVTASRNATPTELQRALTFDLSCFTSLRGCRTFCQMMPLVTADALQRHKAEGMPIPEIGLQEPKYCSDDYSKS
jgi:hypothetical protein